MNPRLWLIPMIVYAVLAILDGVHDYNQPLAPGATQASPAGRLAVAFCAGLFWPIDVVARPLLTAH